MKKIVAFVLILSLSESFAQDKNNSSETVLYNRWSIEINGGQNKPVRPFSQGYFSSNPEKPVDFSKFDHFDVGVRYMLSTAFGLKVDYAKEAFSNLTETSSLPFDTQMNRIGVQGVMNLGRVLHFESFSNRVGLMAHAGIHLSEFKVNDGVSANQTETNGGVMFGITPQVRLADWLAFTADFTVVNNMRQHLNWDGAPATNADNLSGMLYNTSIGLTVYLGKKEKHADWYILESPFAKSEDAALKRIEAIETRLNDTDRDGIVDYLDAENNTPTGLTVDAKGRFIDANKNGTPDEMENSKASIPTVEISNEARSIDSELIEKGLVHLFFDINNEFPNAGSTNNLLVLLNYLQNNSTVKIKLLGSTDSTGNDKINKELSAKRASNIATFLIKNGISQERITYEGTGQDTVYTAVSSLGQDLSRRVSIQIIK
jgi:OOP family OmpA-OmpF porin